MSAKTQNGGLETAQVSVQQGAALQNANVQKESSNIEDAIFDDMLPCNSIAVLDRLKELLEEHKTNSLMSCNDDDRVRRAMWLLLAQYLFPSGCIDLYAEYRALFKKHLMQDGCNGEVKP